MRCQADDRRELLTNMVLTGEGPSTQILKFQLSEHISPVLSAVIQAEEAINIYTPADSSVSAWLGLSRIAMNLDRDAPHTWVCVSST